MYSAFASNPSCFHQLRISTMTTSCSVIICLLLPILGTVLAQERTTVKLPSVSMKSDKPFMKALAERKSSREFRNDTLSLQDLSNLLWCANGVNRPESKHRTVPSAMNKQDIEVYAFLHDGIYLYDPFKHELQKVRDGDYRSSTGSQDFVAKAPLDLVYVSDYDKMDFTKDESRKLWMASVEAGHCSQNVYLYGAAANLGVVVRASIDTASIATLLNLGPHKHVIIAQTVGYPLDR